MRVEMKIKPPGDLQSRRLYKEGEKKIYSKDPTMSNRSQFGSSGNSRRV